MSASSGYNGDPTLSGVDKLAFSVSHTALSWGMSNIRDLMHPQHMFDETAQNKFIAQMLTKDAYTV